MKQKKGHPHDLACGARLRRGGLGTPWLTVLGVQISLVAGYEVFATSGRRATQQSAGESECRSVATHERGRLRVAQGSPGSAGTGLLEQGAFAYFWRIKSKKGLFIECQEQAQYRALLRPVLSSLGTQRKVGWVRVTTRIKNQYVRRSPSGIPRRSRGGPGGCVAERDALAGPGIPGIGRMSLRPRRPGWH